MPGRYQYDIELKSNVVKLLTDMKEVQDRLDTVEDKEYKIKLNVDEKKLSNVISNLEKMLDSLGKGTGDFKQFENLSKELSSIVSEVQNLSKAFGKVDDSGTKTLLSSIQNIDKSLSELSQHILNVNKNMDNMGGNTNGAVKQVENITDAYTNAAKGAEKLAEAQSKIGNKSNISSGNINSVYVLKEQEQKTSSVVRLVDNYGRELDDVNSKLLEGTTLLDEQGRLIRLYHGSDNEFDKFDLSRSNNESDQIYGKGAYLIENERGASNYGNVVTQWYANVRAVMDEEQKLTLEEAKKLYAEFGSEFLSIATGKPMDFDEFFESYLDFDPEETTIIEKMKKLSGFLGKDVGQIMETIGYDAFRMQRSNGTFYTIFDPDRIIRFKEETVKATDTVEEFNQAQKESSKNITTSPIEDVFQGDDKATIDASTTAIKEESQALEQVSTSAKEAATSKDKFTNANKEVKASAESSSTSLDEEKKKIENVGDSAEETKKKLDDVIFKPNTEGFDEIVSKLDIAKDKIEEISKITKSSVWSESQGEYLESYNIKYKNGTSEIRGESSNKKGSNVLRANEVAYDAKAAEQEAKAVQEKWDKNVKAIQDYMDAVTKLNNLNAKDKGTGKYASQIALQEKNVEELKEKAFEARAAISSMINPHDVPLDTWKDYLEVMKKFSQASLGSAESVAKLKDALSNMSKSKIESMESNLKSYQDKAFDLSIKPDEANRFPKYQAQLDSINKAINDYETHINSLKNKGGIIEQSDIDEANRLEDTIKNLLKNTKKFSSGDKGFTNIGVDKVLEKINSILEQNSRMSKTAKDQIKALYNEIYSGNPTRPLNEILDDVYKIVQAEREAGRAGKSWLEVFKDKKIYSFIGQAASMFSFYDLINYGREGISTLKEFDDGLTKISYTMDMTKSKLNDLGKSVLEMANDLDSSIDNAMQVSQIYANMNTSAEEIKKLSEPTLILSNLTGFDASTVADDIQAVTQQFEIAAEDSMHIADVYDQISRNISVDYGKGIESIAEAVQVAGSTANQAGLSFEQLAAIVGKTAEKTRLDGSQIGNGLKTIMTRLSKVGELSDEVDPETLSDASESLHKIGVEVYNADGSFRKFDVIMGELANKWDTLSDAEKSNISFSIAATRQTNLLSSILSNFSDSMSMAEEATNANGNALENNQKWVDSFGGRLQSLENTAKSAWINILDSETLATGIDLLNGLLKVSTEIINTFGAMPTVFTTGGIGAFIANFTWPSMATNNYNLSYSF